MQAQQQIASAHPQARARIPFPQPEKINNRNYWRRKALRHWDAARLNQPAPDAAPDDDVLLTSKQVCALYGGVTVMSLWRWMQDDKAAA